MPARYRELDERAQHTGTYYYYLLGTTSRNAMDGQYREMTDVVGNFPNVNPLDSHRKWTVRHRFTGEQFSGKTMIRKLSSYPGDRVATARDPRAEYGSLLPGDVQLHLRNLLSQSSPSRPNVSLPTALGELKDFGPAVFQTAPKIFKKLSAAPFQEWFRAIPELIREFGNTLIGWAANGYISWRWIVKPMMSDIRKMIQFGDAVEKRRRMLKRLADGKASRRRINLDTSEVVRNQPRVICHSSTGFVAYYDWSIHYTKKVWGTAKWKTSSAGPVLPTRHDTGERKLAWNLTFGNTTFELVQAAWELTPWSWFADWFGAVGDVIALHNNSVPAYWQDACIMRTLTSKAEYSMVPGTLPAWCHETQAPVEEWTIKQRFNDLSLYLPALPTSLPLLDSSKWSILSALAASSVDRGLPAFYKRWNR